MKTKRLFTLLCALFLSMGLLAVPADAVTFTGGTSQSTFAAKPAAPAITLSNVASSGKIKVSWNAVKNASSYKVYRATSKSGTYKLMKTTTGTSYTNTSAEAGTTYYYYVIALANDGTKSARSTIKSRTCDLPRPEMTMSNVASSGKIKVSWAEVEGAVKYEVYRATAKDGEYQLMKTTTNLSYTNTGAVAGQTYYYKVRALAASSAANSAYSTIKSRTCDLPRPEVTMSNVASSGKIKVSWKAVDGAVKYEVHRAASKDGTYTLMKTTTSTSYTNTGAAAGKTYYYKVMALASNSAANSAYSSAKSRTCDLARPVVTIIQNADGEPELNWNAVEGAVGYGIYFAWSADGPFTLLDSTDKTSFTDGEADRNSVHYYQVKALASNSAADSACSAVQSWEWEYVGHTHDWDAGVEYPATCVTNGYIEYTCMDCGETRTEETTAARGFHNLLTETVEPIACTNGWQKVSCTDCGEVISYTTLYGSHEYSQKMNLSEAVKAEKENGNTRYNAYAQAEDFDVMVCTCGAIKINTMEFRYSDLEATQIMLDEYINPLREAKGVDPLVADPWLIGKAREMMDEYVGTGRNPGPGSVNLQNVYSFAVDGGKNIRHHFTKAGGESNRDFLSWTYHYFAYVPGWNAGALETDIYCIILMTRE